MPEPTETITVSIHTDNYHAFALLVDALFDGDLALATDRHGDVHRTTVEVRRQSGNIRQVAKFQADDGADRLTEIEA